MRNAVDITPVSTQAWKMWKKEYPQFKHIGFQQFKKIILHHNELIVQHATETGETIETPMGDFYINRYKPRIKIVDGQIIKARRIDFHKTRELGKTVFVNNIHTDGWEAGYRFKVNGRRLKYGQFWKYRKSRYGRQYLHKLLKSKQAHKYIDKYREQISK